MFGLGREDKAGRQVRIEHRGRNLRASRTGGLAARAQTKLGPVYATVNTSTGARLSICGRPERCKSKIGYWR